MLLLMTNISRVYIKGDLYSGCHQVGLNPIPTLGNAFHLNQVTIHRNWTFQGYLWACPSSFYPILLLASFTKDSNFFLVKSLLELHAHNMWFSVCRSFPQGCSQSLFHSDWLIGYFYATVHNCLQIHNLKASISFLLLFLNVQLS